jgi:cytochrome c oxidase subunit 2
MMGERRRELFSVGAIWLVVTVVAEYVAIAVSLHPPGASREARIIDEAFDLLLYLAIPVFTFVVVVVGYSIVRHRAGPDEELDGPPIRTNRAFIASWMVVTSVLTVLVIVPALAGMDKLAAGPEPGLVIDVRAEQWSWTFDYAGGEVRTKDTLVLPVDTRIQFRITATDVIHSFWIPAFRIKQDAVPGKVTETFVTAERIGEFRDDVGMRVQCAELCGLGHARMWTDVSVVSQEDFDAWFSSAGG